MQEQDQPETPAVDSPTPKQSESATTSPTPVERTYERYIPRITDGEPQVFTITRRDHNG